MSALKAFFWAGIWAFIPLSLAFAAPVSPKTTTIEITGVSGRAPIIEGRPGVAYFTIANSGPQADRLLKIQSPVIGEIEIHQNMTEGDMMAMKPVTALEIPAGGKIVFKPGGYHAMLYDIDGQALQKQTAPLIFTFEKAGNITVEAKIMPLGPKEHHHH